VTRTPYKNPLFLCLLALLIMQYGRAQDTAIVESHMISIKPTTDFDQRFYYVPGERQNVWGYRIGILINDKYKVGIGGYYMNQHADQGIESTPFTRTSADPFTVNKQLYLGTIYYEPYLLRKTLWETSLVFETGYGRTVNSATDKTDNSVIEKQNGLLVPAGLGLSLNLKPPALFHIQCFRWVGINGMVGYRSTIYQQDKEYNYNGAYWSLSGAVFLDRMIDDFHTWKRQHAAARDSRIIKLAY
jgi:hypothetical protein